MRLFGTGDVREIQAESESMSFNEPGVGTNLQKLQLKVRVRARARGRDRGRGRVWDRGRVSLPLAEHVAGRQGARGN